MMRVFSIGPWLMELFNPPPRASLRITQKVGRVVLVVITLVTLCIISALVLALLVFVVQRSHEVLAGIPQLENVLTILVVSIAVNAGCVMMLFQIKRLDRKLIPEQVEALGIEMPLPPRSMTATDSER